MNQTNTTQTESTKIKSHSQSGEGKPSGYLFQIKKKLSFCHGKIYKKIHKPLN